MTWRLRAPLVLGALLILTGAVYLGAVDLAPRLLGTFNGSRAEQERVSGEALNPLWEIWDILQDDFVQRDALDPQPLGRGAVRGLLRGFRELDDQETPRSPANPIPRPREAPAELEAVWNTWVWLFETQPEGEPRLDPPKLAQASIRGLLEALNDPHTAYISPERYWFEAQAFEGKYEGIGSEIYKRGGRFILNPMPESPARAAGIRAGDILLTVNSESVADWSVYDAIQRIRGPKGSSVVLGIQHLGADASINLEIARGIIAVKSVFWSMTNDNIAYLRLAAFYGNTDKTLKRALEEIQAQAARGLVLDLRDNPGGFLSTTVTVTSYFLTEGLVTYEVNGKGDRTDYKVTEGGLVPDLPLAVLVNQFSASGSEVLVGALQDHRRAVVLGQRTFGKGSVNLLKELSDGGGLYYSFAHWYTPNGRLIEREGLEPDVLVAQSVGSSGDLPLEKALEILRAEVS